MKKKLVCSMVLLQALGMLGADFTEEEIRRLISGIEELKPVLPPDLEKLHSEALISTCSKCGKTSICRFNLQRLYLLVERLNAETRHTGLFELDSSKFCPYCGNGRIYLKHKRNRYNSRTKKIELEPGWSSVVPVNEEDLLLLFSGTESGKTVYKVNNIFPDFLYAPTFSVKTAEEYETLIRSIPVQPSEKTSEEWKSSIKKQKKKSEMFQKLTENASILRRKDLDAFLKQLNDPAIHRFNSYTICMTRIVFSENAPLVWTMMTCPECKKVFYLPDGVNALFRCQPLGDLQSILTKLDLTPDYSSLCPHCHPDEQPRLLKITTRFGAKEYVSRVSPADLANLMKLLGIGGKSFTAGQILRLRAILQGAQDDSHIAAKPLPDESVK